MFFKRLLLTSVTLDVSKIKAAQTKEMVGGKKWLMAKNGWLVIMCI